jgi:hypothetical protein
MDDQLKGITSGYHERMHRIGLFEPLYKLKNKNGKDKNGAPIDYYGLGMLTLLFFFEHMLMRKKAGVRELARYLSHLAGDVMALDAAGYENLARSIIETFRPPLGKRSSHLFYNWETYQTEETLYSYLKAAKHDLETYSQYYVLDEHGLELVFATKEFFSEFQLSINQLLLRKQLEKGEFVGALRQIEEMRMNVEQLQERMTKVKQEIQRNIISDESYRRYEQTIQDVHQRLKRENEEFEELLAFVHETRDRLGYEKTDRRDQRAYELILKIDVELGEVHYQHSLLLKRSIELNTTVLKAARESLYFVAVNSFNFDQEIVARLITTPLPVQAARVLVEPLLSLEQYQGWSPLTVFAPQYIGGQETVNDEGAFLSISAEEQEKIDREIQKQNFTRIMELIKQIFKDPTQFTLRQLVKQLKINGQADMLNHRSFYDFWILLHQNSPLNIAKFSDDEQVLPFANARQVFGAQVQKITVEELPETVNVNRRYEIQNFIFCLER